MKPDYALVEAARAGDLAALERLLEVCRPNLRRYAALNCRAADAEDAVQESLLIVTRKLGELRSVAAFTRWLFQLVQRECLRLERQTLPSGEAEAIEAIAVRARDEDLRLDIALAIQSLPDLYREIIVLRDFEELSIAEIAARLEMAPATVKTRIHRGRQLVREHLLA